MDIIDRTILDITRACDVGGWRIPLSQWQEFLDAYANRFDEELETRDAPFPNRILRGIPVYPANMPK